MCSTVRITAALGAFFMFFIDPGTAQAHAFGQRYDLPAPLWLYLSGAGAAIVLSFVVIALFLRGRSAPLRDVRYDFYETAAGRFLSSRYFVLFGQVLFVGIFVLVLAAGFLGLQNPQKNFAPTMVWVIGWIGVAYVSALFGDLWAVISPWRTIYDWFAPRDLPVHAYPPWLGAWPAVVLFAGFAWLELISEAGDSPRQLAFLIVIYSTITWCGMAAYGREAWLRNGEAFAVLFTLFARFAPLGGVKNRLVLRLPALGLLSDRSESVSRIAFVLLALATVTFDGYLETPAWIGVLEAVKENETLRSTFSELQAMGINRLKLIKTIALIGFVGALAAVYFLFCRLMAWAGGAPPSTKIAGAFVLSLVPIAIAYHIAHYLYYLLISGQAIIPLVSDPFDWGWDLFGSADYRTNIAILDAKFVWYLSVTTIVAGHLIAVYLAHVTAMRLFATARAALRSQIPMVVLMVGYTMMSLWILSQPVVSSS